MTVEALTKEEILHAPVSVVWQAITDNNKMKEWYFDIPSFKAEPGFEFRFVAGDDKRQFAHICKVTDVTENKKLCYTWKYEEYKGESKVCFELFPEGDNTRIKLTHTGIESFPADDPSFARESFKGGWDHIIGKSLKDYVEKKA